MKNKNQQLLTLQKFRLTPNIAIPLAFLAVGFKRIGGGRLSWDGFYSSINEYLFHIFAGLFFGWALYIGVSEFTRRGLTGPGLVPRLIAAVSPMLFLITIHQTRGVINDGPAVIAMGAGLAVCAAFQISSGARK